MAAILPAALVAIWSLAVAPPAASRPAARRAESARAGAGLSKQQKRKLARELYVKAERKYSLGQLERALELFSRAYEVLPLSGFLFNIAQCQRQLGNYERAIFLYRRYLQKKPDAANRKLVDKLILECERKQLEKHKAELERKRKAEQARRAAADRRRAVAPRPRPYLPPRRPVVKDYTPLYELLLWTAVGVGVAALATGLAVGLSSGGTQTPEPGSLPTIDVRTMR